MDRRVFDALLGRLRQAGAGGDVGLSDAELLRRWVRGGDPAALELLVWRHGPLVLSVCRRLLRREQDIEDAFQATFLILVKRAASIRGGQAVASWLHTVATRVALEARNGPQNRERPDQGRVERVAAPAAAGVDAEVLAALHEEVGRLPEKYRSVFVLCQLQGKTNEEAARLLGRPVGTILSRLARARQRLRQRLARRGLDPAAALAAPAVMAGTGSVPPELVVHTVQAAVALAVESAGAGAASASAVALMEGVLRAMFVAKIKFGLAIALSVAVLGVSGGVGYHTFAFGQGDSTTGGYSRGSTTRSASPADERRKLEIERQTLEAQVEQAKAQLALAQKQLEVLMVRLADLKQRSEKPAPKTRGTGTTSSTGGGMTGGPSSPGARAPASGAVALLEAKLGVKEAEVQAAKRLVEVARDRLKQAEADVRGNPTPAALASLREAKDALVRHENDVEIKQAELRVSAVELEQARRAAGRPEGMMGGMSSMRGMYPMPARTLEERVKALEARLDKLEKRTPGADDPYSGKRR
jgi:RNA polymerase sigma factor (sigma-70 family)